ncbi:MAG: rRNA maturation RNase YbeY [Patescibacteria group bacterium]|nr:rRNA maturation RNase YbeY [Patescibacteria group bacterium]
MIDILNKTKTNIQIKLARQAGEAVLKKYKKSQADVSVVFIGDTLMRKMNKAWRKKDKITDVLSFRSEDSIGPNDNSLGEIFIDYAQIKRQALKMKHSVKYELVFIVVHGFLHLLGYDDKTELESKKMLKLGEDIIVKYKLI